MLDEWRTEINEFGLHTAQVLANLGYPSSTTVLVWRGANTPELDTGWDLGYFGKGEPHLRRLYLLVDGTFAIDAIGKRKKFMGENSAWVKESAYDRPDLVPFNTSEISGISDCKDVTVDVCRLLIVEDAVTQEACHYMSRIDKTRFQ